VSTSGNEEKLGEPLGTGCPLAVAPGCRPPYVPDLPTATSRSEWPSTVVAAWGSELQRRPVVQRTRMSARGQLAAQRPISQFVVYDGGTSPVTSSAQDGGDVRDSPVPSRAR